MKTKTKSEVKLDFEVLCQKVMEKEGTLRTMGVALAIEIRQQIDRCYSFGVTREEIKTILIKFDPMAL
jgi:hypothetical protein